MSSEVRQRSTALQRFTGGLNNYWDQSSIDDSELASIINFEFSTNGSLTSRPPIWYEENAAHDIIGTPAVHEPLDLIGTYVRLNGTRYLVGTTNDRTWLYNITTKTWQMIALFAASDCTQYMDKLVLCSTTTAGGYWDGTMFNVTNMPKLGGIELMQNRFFGYGVEGTATANTIYWSDITTSGPGGEVTSVWDWTDTSGYNWYVDIGNGDGQWITAMAQGYNDLVIFRNKSTYRYSFNDDPALGSMQSMQQDIGAENKKCVVKFDNSYYVLSGQILYKYQNWLYYPLNAQKVRMGESANFTPRFEHAVSIIGRRCLVWHNGILYALNLDTQTWSIWQTESRAAYFVTLPRRDEDSSEELYYGVSGSADIVEYETVTDYALLRTTNQSKINPVANSLPLEKMNCYLMTKIYDFNTPTEWKRLYYWAADIATNRPIKAVVTPITLEENYKKVSWDELAKDYPTEPTFYTWDDLSKENIVDSNYGTWDNLVDIQSGYETSVYDFQTFQKPQRIEAKLNQSLRFRRIYFELYLECDGSSVTSPVQIYSITPMIGVKAKVAKGAN